MRRVMHRAHVFGPPLYQDIETCRRCGMRRRKLWVWSPPSASRVDDAVRAGGGAGRDAVCRLFPSSWLVFFQPRGEKAWRTDFNERCVEVSGA